VNPSIALLIGLIAVMGIALIVTVAMFLRLRDAEEDARELRWAIGNRSDGVKAIEIERHRQLTEEGWTAEHDDREHSSGALCDAAACYALYHVEQAPFRARVIKDFWPWARAWWKPSRDPVRNLVKAGALIAAEIERLQRKEKANVQRPTSNVQH
jgi:hypothetical protein